MKKEKVFLLLLTVLLICSCGATATKSQISAEMAYEGVNNYCHST